jgi:hypothetical protein
MAQRLCLGFTYSLGPVGDGTPVAPQNCYNTQQKEIEDGCGDDAQDEDQGV